MIHLIESDYKEFNGVKLYRVEAIETFEANGFIVEKGSLGGYISDDVDHSRTWFSDDANVTKGVYINSYINSEIYQKIYVINSYMKNVTIHNGNLPLENSNFTTEIKNSQIKNSTIRRSRLDHVAVGKSSINDSNLRLGNVDNSDVNNTIIDKTNFNIKNSNVANCIFIAGTNVYIKFSTVENIKESTFNVTNGFVKNQNSTFSIKNIGSRRGKFFVYTDISNEVRISAGCFSGTVIEFERRVLYSHNNNNHSKNYFKALDIAINVLTHNKEIKPVKRVGLYEKYSTIIMNNLKLKF